MKNSKTIILPSAHYEADCLRGLISPDSAQLATLKYLDGLCKKLEEDKRNRKKSIWCSLFFRKKQYWNSERGLYLWGGVGRGKSYLMKNFYSSITHTSKKRLHFHEFMQSVHNELAGCSEHLDPLSVVADKWASKVRVICLDEFQVSDITDAMLLARLLENLFLKGVTIVATSNDSPDSLYSQGLQRERFLPAIELIKKYSFVLEMKGDTDYRLRTLESAAVYYLKQQSSSMKAFSKLFEAMASGQLESEKEIFISGRRMEVKGLAGGQIWLDFEQLCVENRSSKDYIKLGNLYHTIFLENVPILLQEDDDSARRFINLIDELYDRQVNLVVLAAALPDELYKGKRLAKAFLRTSSRLMEMKSKEYLAKPHVSS